MADTVEGSVTADTTGSSSGSNRRFNKNSDNKKWDKPAEPRKGKSSGKYPHTTNWKTRSGNVPFQVDDNPGSESITIQHRSGSAIQMLADGSVHLTTHNGKYDIVFGEDRVTVSGLQDITVKGDATMRVYGDYNVTCHKDYNLSVLGNYNVTAKNMNRHILGNSDMQARNENKKLMGSAAKIARGGIAYVAKGSITHASQSDQVHLGGAAGVNLATKKGHITANVEEEGDFFFSTAKGSMNHTVDGDDGHIRMRSKAGKMEFKSKQDMNHKVEEGNYKVTADQGDVGTEASQGNISVKADSGDIKHEAQNFSGNFTQSADITTQQKLDLRATGEAALSGSITHVSGQQVNVKGQTTTKIAGPSGLFLNGPDFDIMEALGLQTSFNFGDFTDPETKKGESRGVHAPDRPADNKEAKQSWNKT